MERKVGLGKAFSDQSGILFTVFFICTIALANLRNLALAVSGGIDFRRLILIQSPNDRKRCD